MLGVNLGNLLENPATNMAAIGTQAMAWLSMNAAGQLQKSAAELKRDIRSTTMGGFLRILLCQYLFSGGDSS
jgi:hypothetical protein